MNKRIKHWAGEPLGPDTFDRCLRVHFLRRRPHGTISRLNHADSYIDEGAIHGPILASLGIARFEYLGWGSGGFAMRARAIDNAPLAVKFTPDVLKRPRHPHIVPALYSMQPVTRGGYGIEVMPLTKTKGATYNDAVDVAFALATTGLWVEDIHEDNIGRWRGRWAVFDVGNGIYDVRKDPDAFREAIDRFLLRRQKRGDIRIKVLRQIARGKLKPGPRPKKPRRAVLALPARG